jgi:hypothetical protein
VVCRNVSVTNQSVPRVKKGCGTLTYVPRILFKILLFFAVSMSVCYKTEKIEN